jgi:hypothetical protein
MALYASSIALIHLLDIRRRPAHAGDISDDFRCGGAVVVELLKEFGQFRIAGRYRKRGRRDFGKCPRAAVDQDRRIAESVRQDLFPVDAVVGAGRDRIDGLFV